MKKKLLALVLIMICYAVQADDLFQKNAFSYYDFQDMSSSGWQLSGAASIASNGDNYYMQASTGMATLKHTPLKEFTLKFKLRLEGNEAHGTSIIDIKSEDKVITSLKISSGQLACVEGDMNGSSSIHNNTKTVSANEWHHVILHLDCNKKTTSAFLDGELWLNNYDFINNVKSANQFNFQSNIDEVELFCIVDNSGDKDTIYINDFNSETMGTVPTDWTFLNGAALSTTLPEADGTAVKTNEPVDNGEGIKRLQQTVFNPDFMGSHIVELDFLAVSNSAGNWIHTNILNMITDGGPLRIQYFNDERYPTEIRKSAQEAFIIDNSKWHHLKAEFDSTYQKFRTSVDDVEWFEEDFSSEGTMITSMTMDVPFDNVLIYKNTIPISDTWSSQVSAMPLSTNGERHLALEARDTLNALFEAKKTGQLIRSNSLIPVLEGIFSTISTDHSHVIESSWEADVAAMPTNTAGEEYLAQLANNALDSLNTVLQQWKLNATNSWADSLRNILTTTPVDLSEILDEIVAQSQVDAMPKETYGERLLIKQAQETLNSISAIFKNFIENNIDQLDEAHRLATIFNATLTATPHTPVVDMTEAKSGGFTYQWDTYDPLLLGDKVIKFDTTGLRPLLPAPPIGVHPRIYFNQSEIPEIYERMKNTESGKAIMRQIRAHLILLHSHAGGGSFSRTADYTKDKYGNSLISNWGYHDRGAVYKDFFDGKPETIHAYDEKGRGILCELLTIEAFDLMINVGEYDPDIKKSYTQRCDELSRAMANWAKQALDDPKVTPLNYQALGGVHFALAYDIHYNNMTKAQQDLCRKAIAKIIIPEPRYGKDTQPYSTTSNWATLNSFELITNLAIEGEEGYNAQLTTDFMKAYYNFITYGWYKSGAPYEGLGKNYQFNATMIAAAKRGYSLFPHPHVKAYAEKFIPNIMQPFGYGFSGTDFWGGSGMDDKYGNYKFNTHDMIGIRWMFNKSKTVDFAWRNYIGSRNFFSYTSGPHDHYYYQQHKPGGGYYPVTTVFAIFAQDFDTTDWEDVSEEVQTDKYYFASDRGLLTMRSGADYNAIWTHFHCRQDLGGHTYGDRNSFAISALGRIWVPYTYGDAYTFSKYHSCVLVDGQGVATNPEREDIPLSNPGHIIHFKDSNNITQITGDAKWSYEHAVFWSNLKAGVDHPYLSKPGWEKVTETPNDFQYIKQNEAHYNIPFYDYADWFAGDKFKRLVKLKKNPMEKVQRTFALIRGDHPYVLVADDIKKDNKEHVYKWAARIANDLVVEKTEINLEATNYKADMILKDPEEPTKKLLVRMLQNDGYVSGAPLMHGEVDNDRNDIIFKQIYAESTCVEPRFKVMFYPFTEGDPLPKTEWNDINTCLKTTIDGNVSYIKFLTNSNMVGIETGSASDFVSYANNDANLSSLVVEGGQLTQAFNPDSTHYTVEVSSLAEKVFIEAICNDAYASVTNTGWVSDFTKPHTILVKAYDGNTKKYKIDFRIISADASLESLNTSNGILIPKFNPEITSYNLKFLADTIREVNLTANASSSAATIMGLGMVPVATTATITVTAEDGETQRDYTVTLISSNKWLFDISLNEGTLSPAFTPKETQYMVKGLNADVTRINISALLAHPAATLQGDTGWVEVPSTARITVIPVAPDPAKYYVIDITQASAIDAAKENKVSVYPNPVQQTLNIEIESVMPGDRIELYTINGLMVLSQEINERTIKLNIKDLSEGFYFVSLKSTNKIITQKVLKRD